MNNIIKELNKFIGNTPLFELKETKIHYSLDCNIYAKLEWYNLFGSIKDRIALNMITKALENGKLSKDLGKNVVIEATSGNTGIALAGVCAKLGMDCIIVMPEGMSKERKEIIQSFNQKVIETDSSLGMAKAILKSKELESEFLLSKKYEKCFLPQQFSNPDNYLAHEKTAKEIIKQTNGLVDIVVCGIGTGGTITGLGKFLKEFNPNIKIVGIEPTNSPLLTKGYSGKHLIQGIGANFIPDILDLSVIDEIITIDDELIYSGVEIIKEIENLDVGLSSVCNYFGALIVAKANKNKNIVTVFPDDVSKYLSVLKK